MYCRGCRITVLSSSCIPDASAVTIAFEPEQIAGVSEDMLKEIALSAIVGPETRKYSSATRIDEERFIVGTAFYLMGSDNKDAISVKKLQLDSLCETESLTLEHEYETARLIEKSTGQVLLEDSFYGDPSCGLIGVDSSWAIVAGEHLTIWRRTKSQSIRDEVLKSIHSLRVKNDRTVELLVDPWSDVSAIWEIDMVTFEYRKIRDFPEYRDREYADDVVW